jgi:uncharacterized protein YndB with AHSA1/START domain
MTIVNGTLETIDGRPALRFERRLRHAPERVWRAVSTPDELTEWFVATVAWGPEAGERFEVAGQTLEILEVDPPRRLAWTWGADRFSFDLHPDGDGCRLVFVHVIDDRVLGAQHAAGWETYLDRLEAVLAGGALSEEAAHEIVGEAHEAYAVRFGLDPAPGRAMIATLGFRDLTLEDGPALRLERRYRHGVDRLWRVLTDPDDLGHWFPGTLEVTGQEPPRWLEGTWFGDRLRFELQAEGDGCRLVFTHAFADRDVSARTAAGWDRCFARVDALLAGAPLEESASLELWPTVHDRYAERFGVDPEIGRRAYAEHPLT